MLNKLTLMPIYKNLGRRSTSGWGDCSQKKKKNGGWGWGDIHWYIEKVFTSWSPL